MSGRKGTFAVNRILGDVLGRRQRRLSTFSGLALGIVMTLIMANVALADNLEVDGDGLIPVATSPMNLGNVCVGQQAGGTALLAIRRTGGGANVYANGANVAVSAGAPSSPTVSTSFGDHVIGLPGNWVSLGNNTMSSDTAASTVTVTATQPPGAKSATVAYTATGAANAGGEITRSATLTINWTVVSCDTTPPVITPNVSATLGSNGWYTSDVTVAWTIVDPESPATPGAGCASTTLTTDTASQAYSCTASSAGGEATGSVTVKRDATAPTISGSAAPAPNGNGWNNTDVTVSFECTDGGSGVGSCGPNQTLSGEGPGQSATGTATDNAGNSASTTVSGINIDKTAPAADPTASPPPNSNGWNNADVTVNWNWEDTGGSGIDTGNCTTSTTSSGEGELTLGASCSDGAGNTGNASHVVRIDKTAPTISGSASPAANAAGWNNTDVTVSFACADAGSGVASCGPDQTLSSEGAGWSAEGEAIDNADNRASAAVSGINIDKTAPSVAVTGVSNGAHYYLGSVPAAGCDTTDGLSGVKTPASLTSSGGTGPGVGTITATCSGATDGASNTAAAVSVTYTVGFHYSGLFRPVDNLPTVNRVKAGSAVPVKFSLGGNYGLGVLMAGFPKTSSMTCSSTAPVDPIDEIVAASSSGLQYDAASDQYTYVWKTDRSWSGCRALVVKLIDGTEVRANFTFTK